MNRDNVGERKILGLEIVQQASKVTKSIREKMKVAQSRQKSYSNSKKKNREFFIGDKVFLKVAPMKGVMRFGKKEKLSSMFIGLLKIFERVGEVAYLYKYENYVRFFA